MRCPWKMPRKCLLFHVRLLILVLSVSVLDRCRGSSGDCVCVTSSLGSQSSLKLCFIPISWDKSFTMETPRYTPPHDSYADHTVEAHRHTCRNANDTKHIHSAYCTHCTYACDCLDTKYRREHHDVSFQIYLSSQEL